MIRKSIYAFLLMFLFLQSVSAQNVNQAQSVKNFRRNTAAVIFSSIGGAVLGLSTLSFYGRPQEHTDNITLGAALGLIGGLVYVLNTPTTQRIEMDEIIYRPFSEPLDSTQEVRMYKLAKLQTSAQIFVPMFGLQF